jgi:hypothetical protein
MTLEAKNLDTPDETRSFENGRDSDRQHRRCHRRPGRVQPRMEVVQRCQAHRRHRLLPSTPHRVHHLGAHARRNGRRPRSRSWTGRRLRYRTRPRRLDRRRRALRGARLVRCRKLCQARDLTSARLGTRRPQRRTPPCARLRRGSSTAAVRTGSAPSSVSRPARCRGHCAAMPRLDELDRSPAP